MRSPEAIAAEAAAQAHAQAQAAAVRAGLRAQAYEAAQEEEAVAAAEGTAAEGRESHATPAGQAAEPEPEPELEVAGVADAMPREGPVDEAASNTMPAEQRERAADVDPASPD